MGPDWRREDTGGLILCGGRSSRMGFEKARLRFPGGTLLERVLERMRRVADPVVLSLAKGQRTPPLPDGVLTASDEIANQGPLWGMAEGFRLLQGRCRRVVVMPVDMPFFTPEWMTRLVDGMEGRPACLYEQGGFANALTAAYDLALGPKLERLVAEGKRRPIFLIEGEHPVVIAEADGPGATGGHPLADIDTPEAYRQALLCEGVGRQGAAEVTLEFSVSRGAETRGQVEQKEFVSLYVEQAAEALACVQRLYPEVEIEHRAGSTPPRLIREGMGGRDEVLASSAQLWRGEHLRLEFAPD